MKWWQQLPALFRSLFRKSELDSELEEEMRSHLELQTQENVEAGMSILVAALLLPTELLVAAA